MPFDRLFRSRKKMDHHMAGGKEPTSNRSLDHVEKGLQTDPTVEPTLEATGGEEQSSAGMVHGHDHDHPHHWHHFRMGRSQLTVTTLILLLGAGASAAFFAYGITSSRSEATDHFETDGREITNHIRLTWSTYEMFGLWIYQTCQKNETINPAFDPLQDVAGHLGYCSRRDFRKLYENIESLGVGGFASAQFVKNISHDYREAVENEARAYLAENYPHLHEQYQGFTEWVPRPNGTGFDIIPRPVVDYYLPVHYVEPVIGNERVVDLDKMTSLGKDEALEAMATRKPVLTSRLRLVQETDEAAYGVIFVHAGTKTPTENNSQTNGAAQVVVRIPQFLQYALDKSKESATIYLYDSTNADKPPDFLGATNADYSEKPPVFRSLPEISLEEAISRKSRVYRESIKVYGREWTIVKSSVENEKDYLFIILCGSMVFAASVGFACWFYTHIARMAKMNKLKSDAETERAENARRQALKERELNEFIAHEVRNPLASAISALSFVSSGVSSSVPDAARKKAILDDIDVMDGSLQFINELLRNMLDVHRTQQSHQINLEMSTVDIRQDILDPVASILFMRGAKVDIDVECPPDLFVESDRMRLKQIMLNLSVNSTKFVERGFIRLRAAAMADGRVELSVEDSGPGIPEAKRKHLFNKFQESLDSLNQGTGIGLCICRNLSGLMGAELFLDEHFQSGVEGCPGVRFVLNLNKPAIVVPSERETANDGASTASSHSEETIPETMSLLIVDDDTMIRKMLKRAILRVAPGWSIEEASNGETALRIVETKTFDWVFMDQYMASVEKQLLGTETTRALRAKNVESFIIGLSANDMQTPFLEAGADKFMFKPFPCKTDELRNCLLELLELMRIKADKNN